MDFEKLLAEHLTHTGKPLKPIRRQAHTQVNFKDQRCPRCSAPSDYLYANNGSGGQLRCKICSFSFQNGESEKNKRIVLRCPYCHSRLDKRHQRHKFDVFRCPNNHCPYYIKRLTQLTPTELEQYRAEPSSFKVHYIFRNFKFELKDLAPESPVQSAINLSRIQATPEVLGLILTYHINYGLSARRTAAIMYDIHGVKVSHQTIHNYEEAVATIIRPFWANYPYQLSSELVGDETYVKVKGKWNYIFYFYDALNKIILADYTTPERTTESAVIAIHQVLQKMPEIPEDLTLTVDGNPIYQVAQIYYAQHDVKFKINQVVGLENKDAISKEYRYLKQTIERLNRTFKSNYRSSTGFGSPKGSSSYTALYSAAYNFLRPHEALKYQVPVPIPAIQEQTRMYSKWLALIALAQEQLPVA
ncbi:DDE-type integrase/transposase/recombinase [Levilactobacillus tujiorum]|nr:DDE-type integrase/transposase/recombinase [Levilactobacillus tujiorum]